MRSRLSRSARSTARLTIMLLLTGLAAGCGVGDRGGDTASTAGGADAVELVSVPAGELGYYPSGEYLKGGYPVRPPQVTGRFDAGVRSEEHTYELHSLIRRRYAVFCLQTKTGK